MRTMYRVTVAAAVIGIAALSLTGSAHAGNGSAVGAGLLGFGVGAVVGSALVSVIAEHGQSPGLFDEVERYVRWLKS